MSEQTYNGWTNYETWAVGMFLDGNYADGTYREVEVRELVEYAANDYDRHNVGAGIWTEEQAKVFSVEDALKEWFETTLPELGASIASDLLSAAVGEVNWRELAESKLAEIAEYES